VVIGSDNEGEVYVYYIVSRVDHGRLCKGIHAAPPVRVRNDLPSTKNRSLKIAPISLKIASISRQTLHTKIV